MPRLFPEMRHPRLLTVAADGRPRLGVCLARTFYRRGREDAYIRFILALVDTVRLLLEDMDIYLIPFCTHRGKHREDDRVINEHVLEFFRGDPRVIDTTVWERHADDVLTTYHILSGMDLVLCSRFHAHVFAIALERPFVSFSKNRKVTNLMTEFQLQDLVFPFKDWDGMPIDLDAEALAAFVRARMTRREQIHTTLTARMAAATKGMDRFIQAWRCYIEKDRLPIANPPPLHPRDASAS